MSMRAAAIEPFGNDCAAACLCGGDERDPCPWCQAQDAEADRQARERSADVEFRFWEGVSL